jgi:hypothetical protein
MLRSGFSGWQACERSPEVNDVSEELQRNIAGLNQVIETNNRITVTLPQKQREVRDEPRVNAVAVFIRDINLTAERKKLASLKDGATVGKGEFDSLINGNGMKPAIGYPVWNTST